MNTYKICLIKNRYTGIVDINKYVVDWFKNYANLNVTIDTITTDFDVTTMKASNNTWSGVIPGIDIIDKLKTVIPENKYNAVVFLYGNDLDGIRVSSTNFMGANPLYPDTEIINTYQATDGGRTINHELFHCFFFKAKKLQFNIVDNMDTYFNDADLMVNGIIDTNREIALQTLRPYWTQICAFRNIPTTSKWKYFKLTEFTNYEKTHTVAELKTELVDLLDKMRGECGFPFKITSGKRTKFENDNLIDAVGNSAHLTGLAVDIQCLDDTKRDKMLEVFVKNGITRKGIAKTYLHIDIDKTKPQNVTWLYN